MGAVKCSQVNTSRKVNYLHCDFIRLSKEDTAFSVTISIMPNQLEAAQTGGLLSTHTCMHVYTKGESLEWLKVTVSNIWDADLSGQWQRREPGSVAGGVVTCGTQRAE